MIFPISTFGQNHSYWFQTNMPLGSEFTSREELIKDITIAQNKAKSKRVEKEFLEVNEYHIDRFLNSGMVITSSPANNYLNQVADKLLFDNPSLRAKLKFYLVYTTEVNAFTFTNGMIFINLGLFARLKSEAQLAFILSHEIAHYKMQHAFEKYTMNEEAVGDEDEKEFLEIILSKFSREKEFEADKVGYEIFLNSGYKLDQATSVFDILLEAEFPLENKSIPKSAFEGKYLKLPTSYYADTAISIVLPVEENDTNSTHPNSNKRKEIINGLVSNKGQLGKDYLVSSSHFDAIKVAAQFELSPAYLLEGNYINSLYNTELLLSQYPNSEILLENKIKAIYYLLANINFGTSVAVIRLPRKINGEIRKFHQLFKKLNSEEVNALALRIAWDLHKAKPHNKEIKRYCDGITKFFAEKVSDKLTYFAPLNMYNEDSIQSFYKTDGVEIKQKRYTGGTTIRKEQKRSGNFAKYSMPDYLGDMEFIGTFKEIAKSVTDNKALAQEDSELQDVEEDSEVKQSKKKAKTGKKKKNNEVVASGEINKILVVDISSFNVDLRYKKPIRYRNIKSKQIDLVQTVKACGAMNQIEVEVFNPATLTSTDSAFFNDRTILERWKKERLANYTMPQILPSEFEALENLCNKYGTTYVAFIQTSSIKVPNKNKFFMFTQLIYTCVHPALFGIAMYSTFTTSKQSGIYFPVYDLKTGAMIASFGSTYELSDHQDLFKSEFYSFFHSIKNK